MRVGYNRYLAERLERHPASAKPLLEVVTAVREDVIDTKAEFEAAADTSGFELLPGGGARLLGVDATQAENATINAGADIGDLPPPLSDAVQAAVVEWIDGREDRELFSATARLDPNTGAGLEVTHWVAQLFRIAEITTRVIQTAGGTETESRWHIQPICAPVRVAAGATTSDVQFDFVTDAASIPRVGPAPKTDYTARGDAATPTAPTTILMVWAIKGGGETAANVAWLCDSAASQPQTDGNGNELFGVSLGRIPSQDGLPSGTVYSYDDFTAGLPVFALIGRTYTQSQLDWTVDIGASPGASTILELIAEYLAPGDSSVALSIDDGVAGFTAFVDGDQIGEDRTPYGGSDLSALARQQTYSLRAVVTPVATGDATPTLMRTGIREQTALVVDGLVNFGDSAWAVDPQTCQSEVPSATFEILRNGVRDYRSFAEDLFALYHAGSTLLRVWIGHVDLDRQHWLHIDDFVVSNYEPRAASVSVKTVSPLSRLLRTVPESDEADAVAYESATPKAIYDDIVSRSGIPGRHVGPGIESLTPTASKELRKPQAGLDILRQRSFVEGGALISSQGRVKFVKMFDAQGAAAVFRFDEVTVLGVDPGLDRRVPTYSAEYGYDDRAADGQGAYLGKATSSASATAAANLGEIATSAPDQAEDDVARWLEASGDAGLITARQVEYFGAGMPQIRFRSSIPRPHLEPGDPVVVEQDVYVGRDANRDEPVRGKQAAFGRISACHDIEGREFTVWVWSFSDFIVGDGDVVYTGYMRPGILDIVVGFRAGVATAHVTCKIPDSGSVKIAINDLAFPSSGTVAAQTETALDADGYAAVPLAGTWSPGDTIYLSALAYENADATGAVQATLFKQAFTLVMPVEDANYIELKETARTEDEVTYEILWGDDTVEGWVYDRLFEQPISGDSVPADDEVPDRVLINGTDTSITFSVPPPQRVRWVTIRPITDGRAKGAGVHFPIFPTQDPPDRLVSVTVEVDSDTGGARVRFTADERAGSVRYAYTVAAIGAGTPPVDAVVEAGTVVALTNGIAEITLAAATIAYNQEIRLRAVGYINADGTGYDTTATDHGEIMQAEAFRLKPPVELEVTTEDDTGASLGTLGVTVHDEGGAATALYKATKIGSAAWSADTLVSAAPADGMEYTATVAKQEKHHSFIRFRLYYAVHGAAGYIEVISGGFDFGRFPDITIIPRLNEDDQTGSCAIIGDVDTSEVKVAASTAGTPSAATVRAQVAVVGRMLTPTDIGTLVSGLNPGDKVYFAAFGYGPGGEESTELATAEAVYKVVAPTLNPTTTSETSTTGTFGVTVSDTAGQADSLHYQTRQGGVAWPASWTLKSASPADATEYSETVTLVEDHTSQIRFRLTYTLRGKARYIIVESPAFDLGKIPRVTVLGYIAEDTGAASAIVPVDFDTASVRIAASTSGSPSDATVRAATPINVPAGQAYLTVSDVGTLLTASLGDIVYWKAFGYSGAGGTGTESPEPATDQRQHSRLWNAVTVQDVLGIPVGYSVVGDQKWNYLLKLFTGPSVLSLNVDYSFVRPHKLASQPPPSTLFQVNYDVDTSPGRVNHTVQDALGAAASFVVQDYGDGSLLYDGDVVLTITPYNATGGSGGAGVAGAPVTIGISLEDEIVQTSAMRTDSDTGVIPSDRVSFHPNLPVSRDATTGRAYVQLADLVDHDPDSVTVQGFATGPSGFVQRRMSRLSSTESGGYVLGEFVYVQQTAATGYGPQGLEAYVLTSHASGTVALAIAIPANIENYGAGTLTWARAYQGGVIQTNASGTIDDGAAFYAAAPVKVAGTFTRAYGLYVVEMTAADTNWAVYTAGATPSFFGGQVRFDAALTLKDGITAPSAVTGYAAIYVDTADGDLKVKFADGTTKTLATDT